MDKKVPVTTLFMDMTKAFDYVEHRIVLIKFSNLGIREKLLDLIKSYLVRRKRITKIVRICNSTNTEHTYLSKEKCKKYDVPQGSVLGPLLFLC